jgi:DNA mismatch repair protein MSH5
VLNDIQRRRNVNFLPGDDASLNVFRVRTIEMFSLSDVMFVNAETMVSLQIFQSESHPNTQMQGPTKAASGAKENLSVFGLFKHLAHTPQGKHKLRQIFLRPSLDLTVIEGRQTFIQIMLLPGNDAPLAKIVKSLKRIKNIRTAVIHLQKGTEGATNKRSAIRQGVWGNIQEFTYHALRIIEAVCEVQKGSTLAIMKKVRR